VVGSFMAVGGAGRSGSRVSFVGGNGGEDWFFWDCGCGVLGMGAFPLILWT
jgi:hypothetical protein